ncbi:hypothetical protein EDD85DRAFT_87496 [Armillaria nabsnona]|nr:hypothetical protein EDD85DRAFT_87496 [Armillaria nabsnona]
MRTAKTFDGYYKSVMYELGLELFGVPYGDGPLVPYSSPLRVDASYGKFWTVQTYEDDRLIQLVATSAYSTRRGYTAESFIGQPFTSRRKEHPSSLKTPGDGQFLLGVYRPSLPSRGSCFSRYAYATLIF